MRATIERKLIFGSLFLIGFILFSGTAFAVEGGTSNYIPGFYGDFGVAVAPQPGFYLQNTIYYYHAATSTPIPGEVVQADLDLDLAMEYPILLYVTGAGILGGRYALGAGGPLVHADITSTISLGPFQQLASDETTAVGDVCLIPLSLYWKFGDLYANFYETIMAPPGSYDKDNLANAGLNYWSFDTNAALTSDLLT